MNVTCPNRFSSDLRIYTCLPLTWLFQIQATIDDHVLVSFSIGQHRSTAIAFTCQLQTVLSTFEYGYLSCRLAQSRIRYGYQEHSLLYASSIIQTRSHEEEMSSRHCHIRKYSLSLNAKHRSLCVWHRPLLDSFFCIDRGSVIAKLCSNYWLVLGWIVDG